MLNQVQIEFPPELLLGLHLNAEEFAEVIKRETAFALFHEGKISSGIAASWLGIPRVTFLFQAMTRGIVLLEDSHDDLRRETSLL